MFATVAAIYVVVRERSGSRVTGLELHSVKQDNIVITSGHLAKHLSWLSLSQDSSHKGNVKGPNRYFFGYYLSSQNETADVGHIKAALLIMGKGVISD